MKTAILIILSLVSFQTWACEPCKPIDALTVRFNAVNFLDHEAKKQARQMLLEVYEVTNRYLQSTSTGPTYNQEMTSMIKLIAASAPYDVESAGTIDLSILIKRHNLLPLFQSVLVTIPNRCQREDLAKYMSYILCEGTSCPNPQPPFFEDCIRSTQRAR